MNTFTIAAVSAVAGFLFGFFGRGLFEKTDMGESKANTFVLVIVTLIWATSVLIDIVSPDYETSPLIHGLMGAIVGFFFKPWQNNDSVKNTRNANNENQYSEVEKNRAVIDNTKQFEEDKKEAERRNAFDESNGEVANAEADLIELKRRRAYNKVKEKRRRK